MSEIINNREHRQQKLKSLIIQLHEGRNFDDVKKEFEETFGEVSAAEISALEQSIIMEGMPVEEVQRLCNVHSAVFKGSIEDIHGKTSKMNIPGHPLNTFKKENDALKQFMNVIFRFHIDLFKETDNEQNRGKLIKDLNKLNEVDKHYLRKENLVFPYLERYGIEGPPKVMWGVDDDIRDLIRKALGSVMNPEKNKEYILEEIDYLLTQVDEMIFKEENILLPMCEDTLTQDEWLKIAEESHELGYTMIDEPPVWIPPKVIEEKEPDVKTNDNEHIHFETGFFTKAELETMLNGLPFDITFIDKDDIVRYFSKAKDRIFPRTKSVIGRNVENCHPPGSVHVVKKLIEDFKSGIKEHEDFYIKMKGMYVFIRYFALRNESGEYAGTLEVTQNIQPIQEISGEKRLVSD